MKHITHSFGKRILALLLMAVLLLSLTACGDTPSSDAEPTLGASQAPQTTNSPTPVPSESASLIPGTVYVEGNQFMVDGKELWINGVNTPWDKWNDFGGNFSEIFWEIQFELLHRNGVNASRIWITCNGDVGIHIDENGMVTGATDEHWQHLDRLFELADQYGIYIMATLISFDHFKDQNANHLRWRAMVQNEEAIDSYVNNYVIPFCERYDKYDSLWSIDLCNEPDWVNENAECGKLAWDDLGNYFARCAAAIHENSDILVTVGFGMVKYNSDHYNGNYGSDAYLQSCYANDNAYLDFYSTHYYEWQAPWYSFPFDKSPADFYLDTDRPALLGEFAAHGMMGDVSGSQAMTPEECYVGCYENGWNGAMAWTSNGVDDCGNIQDLLPAVSAIIERAADKVFPGGMSE